MRPYLLSIIPWAWIDTYIHVHVWRCVCVCVCACMCVCVCVCVCGLCVWEGEEKSTWIPLPCTGAFHVWWILCFMRVHVHVHVKRPFQPTLAHLWSYKPPACIAQFCHTTHDDICTDVDNSSQQQCTCTCMEHEVYSQCLTTSIQCTWSVIAPYMVPVSCHSYLVMILYLWSTWTEPSSSPRPPSFFPI